jgi:O-antigen ligase
MKAAMDRARSAQISLAIDWGGVAAFGITALGVTTLAAADGGYFPESWAWLSALTLFPAALLLIATDRVRLSRLEMSFLALLLAYDGWILLSCIWSISVTSTVFEAQRTLAYLGAAFVLLLVVTRRTSTHLLAGALAGVTAVATFACLTRLLPDRFVAFDSVAGYRLSDPIGYWNGLGVFSAMGVLLALGFAARAQSPLARAAASALPVVLVSTLYFTFSRGAWIALAFGLVVAIAVDPRRLRLIFTTIALAPWSVLAVTLAARSDALTVVGAPLTDASREGHALLPALLVLSALSGAVGFGLAHADRRLIIGPRARRAFGGTVLAGAVTTLVILWATAGPPYSMATRAWTQFRAPPKETSGDLNDRLFNLSSNGRIQQWSVARDDFVDHVLDGRGAGTFAYSWAERRPSAFTVQDAHSLYIETVGELGIVGLVLLAGALALPLAAAARARCSRVLPAALGAYSAFVLHAGVDWDWELPGVTLVALISGVSLFAAARPERLGPSSLPLRASAVALVLALSALAFVSVLGNVPLGRSREALDESRWSEAANQARAAHRWAPWSSEPLRLLGESELGTGHSDRARASFRAALDRDPETWQLWVDMALASSGAERRLALARARQLNPHSEQVRELRATP